MAGSVATDDLQASGRLRSMLGIERTRSKRHLARWLRAYPQVDSRRRHLMRATARRAALASVFVASKTSVARHQLDGICDAASHLRANADLYEAVK